MEEVISALVLGLCGVGCCWLSVRFLERRDERRLAWRRESLTLRAKGADSTRIDKLEERTRALEIKGLR